MFFVGLSVCIVYVYDFNISEITGSYIVSLLMGTFIVSILFNFFKAYSDDSLFSKWRDIRRLLGAWSIAFAVLLTIAFALKISDYYSRVWAVTWFVGGACALLIVRVSFCVWIDRRAREGILADRCVIFGAGELGQRFAAAIKDSDDPSIGVLGFIDDRETRVPRFSNGLKVLGNFDRLLDLIRLNMVDHVLVALPWNASDRLRSLVEQLALTPVRVSLVSEPLDFTIRNSSIRCVNKSPIIQILDYPLTESAHLSKNIEDFVISSLALIFISPLMILLAILIKIDSPGPVFYRQTRYGFNNNQIEVWKFRSMYFDPTRVDAPMLQATRDDPRVTRLGRFLRRSSLDELPQFFNVLTGDMSIVGPRPHAVQHTYNGQMLEDIIHRYAARHRVKPGITGWAQVNGWRGETDTLEKIEKRLEHDLYYIENWSIFFDFLIMIKTIGIVFRDEKAY